MAEQNFQNHTKWVPAFHFFTQPIFLVNFFYSLYRLWLAHYSFESIMGVLVAAAFVVGSVSLRLMSLTVQDRVIRLEMSLRMKRLLPDDIKQHIEEFTPAQLIALRFASDAELPDLAARVLKEKLNDRKAIKQLIKNWKPDYLRA